MFEVKILVFNILGKRKESHVYLFFTVDQFDDGVTLRSEGVARKDLLLCTLPLGEASVEVALARAAAHGQWL